MLNIKYKLKAAAALPAVAGVLPVCRADFRKCSALNGYHSLRLRETLVIHEGKWFHVITIPGKKTPDSVKFRSSVMQNAKIS